MGVEWSEVGLGERRETELERTRNNELFKIEECHLPARMCRQVASVELPQFPARAAVLLVVAGAGADGTAVRLRLDHLVAGVAAVIVATTDPSGDPQCLVDSDARRAHRVDRVTNATGATVVDTCLVRGCVMDEPAGDAVAERGILPGVQDERVPSDIGKRCRSVRAAGVLGAQLQEAERLVHDAFRQRQIDIVVLHDALGQARPQCLVHEVLVGQHDIGLGY